MIKKGSIINLYLGEPRGPTKIKFNRITIKKIKNMVLFFFSFKKKKEENAKIIEIIENIEKKITTLEYNLFSFLKRNMYAFLKNLYS